MNKCTAMITVVLAAGLLSGCVTGRRVVPLEVPTAEVSEPKVTLVIQSIQDVRHFENKPSSPSTPSAKEDVTRLTPDVKATLIARQRNGYGKAMGDVVLPSGQTVESTMKALVTSVLAKRGYGVVDSGSPNTVVVTVHEFWGWMTPGFLWIPFDAKVGAEVEMNINGQKKTVHASGLGTNRAQVASNANWALTYERAFAEFEKKLQSEMELAGL